jgi:hypothetical protein
MSTDLVTYVLMGLYPAPVMCVVGFALVQVHVRVLAARGGEERYPASLQRVVEKYRRENYADADADTEAGGE